jgi:hypothetical protein
MMDRRKKNSFPGKQLIFDNCDLFYFVTKYILARNI